MQPISLHKPHPDSIVKRYVIDDVLRLLTDEKLSSTPAGKA